MSSKHPEEISEGGTANSAPPDAFRSTPALRPDAWTEADIEEMDRLATAGIGKRTRTRPLRRVNRLLDFKIGERCIQAIDGDTVYMVTNDLHGWKHVAYYRNELVGWTELGRGLLTECVDHCLGHLNTNNNKLPDCVSVIDGIRAWLDKMTPEETAKFDAALREKPKTLASTVQTDQERFTEYLKWASNEVASWPEWKQKVLG